jgi:hypothetical protein
MATPLLAASRVAALGAMTLVVDPGEDLVDVLHTVEGWFRREEREANTAEEAETIRRGAIAAHNLGLDLDTHLDAAPRLVAPGRPRTALPLLAVLPTEATTETYLTITAAIDLVARRSDLPDAADDVTLIGRCILQGDSDHAAVIAGIISSDTAPRVVHLTATEYAAYRAYAISVMRRSFGIR